jgi:hypothetical protein
MKTTMGNPAKGPLQTVYAALGEEEIWPISTFQGRVNAITSNSVAL